MAWRFLVTPTKEEDVDLTRRPPMRPRIGGGVDFSIKRGQLGSKKALEQRRLKLSGKKFAGVRSVGRRWREEEDEVVRAVKK